MLIIFPALCAATVVLILTLASVLGSEVREAVAEGSADLEGHAVVSGRGGRESTDAIALGNASPEGVLSDGRLYAEGRRRGGRRAGAGAGDGGGGIQLKTISGTAVLVLVAGAGERAVGERGLGAARVRLVSAVALASVLGTPVREAGAVDHARLEGHAVVGEGSARQSTRSHSLGPAAHEVVPTDLRLDGERGAGRRGRRGTGDCARGGSRGRRHLRGRAGLGGRGGRRRGGRWGCHAPAGGGAAIGEAGACQRAGEVEEIAVLAGAHVKPSIIGDASGDGVAGGVERVQTVAGTLGHGNGSILDGRDWVSILRCVAWHQGRNT